MHWGRALAVWLLLMLVESLHGTLRQLLLVPVIGDAAARRVSVFTGVVLIFLVTLLTIRWIGATRRSDLLRVGAMWVLLTLVFEISLGRLAFGLDWARVMSDYDLRRGGLMPLGLICMLFIPLAAARLRTA